MTEFGVNQALIGKAGSRAELMTPALLIDIEACRRNIRVMADFARAHGVALRPHAKTHKSARIAREQVDAGAAGICVVTVGEAEAMVAGGIPGVLITSPVVTPAKIDRLMALNAEAEGLCVVADNPGNVDALASAAASAGRPLTVLVDLDMGKHRTGVPGPDAGVALAQRIGQANALDFGGVQAYAGHLQHIDDYAERRDGAMSHAEPVAELAAKLDAAGLAPPLVTGAGTGSHDIDAAGGVFNELQTGSYIFNDVQYDTVALRADGKRPFESALFVQVAVVSNNTPGQVTTDGGLKRFATDGPFPEVVRGAPPGTRYRFMGDEHGALLFAEPDGTLPLGARVECLTPHCDPTVNLYDHFHIVEGDTLVDIWPVDGRGAV